MAGGKQRPSKNPRGRYIKKAIKGQVYERDDGQCTFKDSQGRRCSERRGLEYDHIVPHALAGASTAENLRLRCRAHNQLHAEDCFGTETVQRRAVRGPPG
jgi:5-methylcytosine-specific restriction endonuclease McrA